MYNIIYLLIIVLTLNIDNGFANPPIVVQTIEDGQALSKDIGKDLIVIFKGDRCIHCERLLKDIINDQTVMEDKIICYIDTKKFRDIAKKYEVSSIPDSRVYRKNKFVNKVIGYSNKEEYKKLINK